MANIESKNTNALHSVCTRNDVSGKEKKRKASFSTVLLQKSGQMPAQSKLYPEFKDALVVHL